MMIVLCSFAHSRLSLVLFSLLLSQREKADFQRRRKEGRWTWTPRQDVAIATALVGGTDVVENPQHLIDVYSAIFKDAVSFFHVPLHFARIVLTI